MERQSQPVGRRQLTDAAVPGVVAAAALKVSHAAVPGEGVHDAGRADGVYKGRFPGSWGRAGEKLSDANIDISPGLLRMKLSRAAKVREGKEPTQFGQKVRCYRN